MKITIYRVINKETKEVVFANCRSRNANEYLANLENPEQYEIVAKYNVCI